MSECHYNIQGETKMSALKHFHKTAFAILFLVLFSALDLPAQNTTLRLPRPSQKASVMQTVGVTDITITYSRPGVKGRKIWGDAPSGVAAGTTTLDDARNRVKDAPIVPYGRVWRTGANEATTFTVTDEVMINGQKLAAGTYSLHTIPGRDEWTIIFNSDAGQWGSFRHDEKKDVLRVKAKPQTMVENQEWLDFDFPVVTDNSAQVVIRWEKIAVPFTVEIPNLEALLQTKIDAAVAANPTDWNIPLAVARRYANDEKKDKAIAWADKSIKVKETYQNLAFKAQMLAAAGRKNEAIILADKAIAQGKTDKADTSALEKWLADMKAGKM
jgi:predicted transcriptional regulator